MLTGQELTHYGKPVNQIKTLIKKPEIGLAILKIDDILSLLNNLHLALSNTILSLSNYLLYVRLIEVGPVVFFSP